jgi:UDP-N-acetyl-D-mannosaminuronic acid transferase (WecB/TagA/CpsF family)
MAASVNAGDRCGYRQGLFDSQEQNGRSPLRGILPVVRSILAGGEVRAPGPREARVELAGITAQLLTQGEVVRLVIQHAGEHTDAVLTTVLINFSHLYYFGSARRAARAERRAIISSSLAGNVHWLGLLDSPLLAKRAGQLNSGYWPRMRASDILGPMLDEAESRHLRLGFLGSPRSQADFRSLLCERWPRLRVNGYWAPSRTTLDDPDAAAELAGRVRKARVDVLVVSLGTPRQERWIAEHAAASGARVCLAVGDPGHALSGRRQRPGASQLISGLSLRCLRAVSSDSRLLQPTARTPSVFTGCA